MKTWVMVLALLSPSIWADQINSPILVKSASASVLGLYQDGKLSVAYVVCLDDSISGAPLSSAPLKIENLAETTSPAISVASDQTGCVTWQGRANAGKREAAVYSITRASLAPVDIGFVLKPNFDSASPVETILLNR